MQDAEDQQAFLPRTPHNSRSSNYRPPWASKPSTSKTRKLVIICSVALLLLFGFSFFHYGSRTRPGDEPTISNGSLPNAAVPAPTSTPKPKPLDPFGPESNLIGKPAARFRDNLRPDRRYITSWLSAGWTNDVMTYMNLVYLALITDRIPIIPPFIPSHIGSAPHPDFGAVFDIPRLRKALGKPVLEWHEVKDRESQELEELGCWNTWEAVQENDHNPRGSALTDILKLDLSYTKAPSWIKLIPHFKHDQFTTFWALATLAFPEGHAANLVTPLPSPQKNISLPPDEHLLCYDYLYYVCANTPFEFDFDFSPAWRFVGQYMYWTPRLEELAHEYVRKTIGVEGETTPPWIAIHMRHGDFKVYCEDKTVSCLPSIPVIARRVEEVKAEIKARKGITVDHVIMTSDERNTTWWDEVKAQGWYQVDHSQTAEKYGLWYPVFIDAAIQSLGVGFVGTDRSTMSVIARRRVQSWSDGAARIIKWGKPDSDDH